MENEWIFILLRLQEPLISFLWYNALELVSMPFKLRKVYWNFAPASNLLYHIWLLSSKSAAGYSVIISLLEVREVGFKCSHKYLYFYLDDIVAMLWILFVTALNSSVGIFWRYICNRIWREVVKKNRSEGLFSFCFV